MNSPPIIKGLLFDFDGTLARTMEDLLAAWQYAFRPYGIEIKKEDYFPLEGVEMLKIAKTLAGRYNLSWSEQEFSQLVELKEKYYLKHHSFSFYPGVIELIDALYGKGISLGIVTASSRQKLEKTVPTAFLQKFKAVISRELAGRGKPFPDPYLLGLQKLGLRKDKCIVIENAPLGIQAAKRAGLYCIAIASTMKKEELIGADTVISTFSELPQCQPIESLLSAPGTYR